MSCFGVDSSKHGDTVRKMILTASDHEKFSWNSNPGFATRIQDEEKKSIPQKYDLDLLQLHSTGCDRMIKLHTRSERSLDMFQEKLNVSNSF